MPWPAPRARDPGLKRGLAAPQDRDPNDKACDSVAGGFFGEQRGIGHESSMRRRSGNLIALPQCFASGTGDRMWHVGWGILRKLRH